MKTLKLIFGMLVVMFALSEKCVIADDSLLANSDTTVTDFDGNVYSTVTIGNQVWLKENLKSTHYADGTEIPGVVAYNMSDSLANIYGMLYTWDASMRNSTVQSTQGVCPNGWHLPSDSEWKELENYLGGASIAGGKMKETGTQHWFSPNTGATNSSGLSILAAGEYDAFYSPNIFQLLKEYAVFWTSTQVNTTKARERYLQYNTLASKTFDWYKVMKYSIRCVKDEITEVNDDVIKLDNFSLSQNYPNPFNPCTTINFSLPVSGNVNINVFNNLGEKVLKVLNEYKNNGNYLVNIDMSNFSSGIYYYNFLSGKINETRKMTLIK